VQRGRRETAEAFPLDRRRRLHGDERRRARHLRGLLLGGGLVFGAELAFGGDLSFSAELAFGAEEQGEPALHTTARPAFSRLGQRAAGVNAGLIGVCACRKSERKDRRRTEKLAQAPDTPWWRRRCPRLQQRRGPPAAWTRAFLSARTSRAKCEGVLALIIAHGSDYDPDARLMTSASPQRLADVKRHKPEGPARRSCLIQEHPRASVFSYVAMRQAHMGVPHVPMVRIRRVPLWYTRAHTPGVTSQPPACGPRVRRPVSRRAIEPSALSFIQGRALARICAHDPVEPSHPLLS
jgi:hypothetical protein